MAKLSDRIIGDPLNVYSNPNLLINGDFAEPCWQRGTSVALQDVTNYGAADRWFTRFQISGDGNFSKNSDAPLGFRNSARIVRNDGQTSEFNIELMQILESSDSIPLQGESIVVSFYVKDAGGATSSTLTTRISTGTGIDEGSSAFADNGWTGFTINDKVHPLTSDWVRLEHTIAVPADATQIGLKIVYAGTDTAGVDDGYLVTGVKLEQGTALTPFTRAGNTVAGEFAICQRYFQLVGGNATGDELLGLYSIFDPNGANLLISPVVDMRIPPTPTISSLADFLWVGTGQFGQPTAIDFINLRDNSIELIIEGVTGANGTVGILRVGAPGFIMFDAEL